MIHLLIFTISIWTQDPSVSPDGRFILQMKGRDLSDLQTEYTFTLTNKASGKSKQLVNCTRRDLGKPNFYWDKHSKFLIIEDCSESIRLNKIRIVNLESFETDFQLE